MAKEQKEDKQAKEGEGEGAKKGNKKLLIIIAAVVILAGGGAGAFFALGGSKEGEEGEEGDGSEEGGEPGAEGEHAELPGAIVPLEVFIVNLSVKGSFLKATIQLELATPEPGHDFEHNVPKIRDGIIRVLSNKVAQEILSAEGKEKLREEVKKAANDALGTEDVTAVFFTEFIVQ